MSTPGSNARSAYVHVPFCARRCGYCNFTLVAGREDLIEAYLAAITRELRSLEGPHEVDTLSLGGGTPSHLRAADAERLLAAIADMLPLAPGAEYSLEANPNDVDAERVGAWTRFGVNRVSLGAQSFSPRKLEILERDHGPAAIGAAAARLQAAGCQVSLDLIFGVPGETLDEWRADLRAALELRPDHLSTYGLTIEQGTSFWARRRRAELASLDEDQERRLYETAIDTLTVAGYEHYEVSSFAAPGRRCRHNETYWSGDAYLGFGPGAARFVEGRRETNHRSVTTYLKRIEAGQSPVAEIDVIPPEDRARELLVVGLRRLGGVDREEFERRTGMEIEALCGPALRRVAELGLVVCEGSAVRLTRAGLLVSDSVFGELLG